MRAHVKHTAGAVGPPVASEASTSTAPAAGAEGGPVEESLRAALGRRIRAGRQERGLSTVQVARAIGVSPSLISQVERGLTAPSLDVLAGIAGCLERPISALFSAEPPASGGVAGGTSDLEGLPAHRAAAEVLPPSAPAATPAAGADPTRLASPERVSRVRAQLVRAGRRKTLGLPGSVTYELLSPDLKHQIELIWVEFAPGQAGEVYAHEGEEQMVVIRGQMHYWVRGEEFVLDAGDAITIDASQPHCAVNRGAEPAVVIAAIAPPSF